MFHTLLRSFFGCAHPRTTFPITVSRSIPDSDQKQRRTYVACLDCGEEIAYNWQKMQTEGRCQPEVAGAPAAVSLQARSSSIARFLHTPDRTLARTR